MIYYLVIEGRAPAMQTFLASSGTALTSRLRIVTYESLLKGQVGLDGHDGAYIFTNINAIRRLGPQARQVIFSLHDRLVKAAGAARVFNDPRRSLGRYELLRTLYARGINGFNAYRLSEDTVPQRFPVIIRREAGTEHKPLTLVRNPDQYRAAVRAADKAAPDLVAIEFCDTADASGVFRKYGAFVVGERIVPRHIFFSRNWMVKQVELTEPHLIAEELAFVNGNPHADVLLECARAAGMSYGRIDYGVREGRPQIWEINSNADIVNRPGAEIPARRPVHARFVAMFAEALCALDTKPQCLASNLRPANRTADAAL